MKILVINWQDIKNPFGGGAEVHMHEIFKRIAAKGHSVTIFACEIEGEPLEEVIDGIRIIRKGKRNTFNFIVPTLYKHRFAKENYDVIVDNINKIPFYTPLYIDKPLLAISHHFFGSSIFKEVGFIAGLYVWLSEKFIDIFYKHTDIAVVSQSTLDEFLQRGFNPKRFTIVQNAITQSEYPMKVGTKKANKTITFFGRLKKYKSPDHLFKAFAMLKDDFPDAKLEIIGRGDFKPNLEALAKRLKIQDRVVFHGFVDDAKKIEILSYSHIAVNTSIKEGWGITNIEANACGTPVVCANSPGLRDSVKDGLSGVLYEYGNIKQLAQVMREILSDNQKNEMLCKGAVQWAELFSWDNSADLMIELLNKVAKQDTF